MRYWIIFYCLLMLVCAKPDEDEDRCLEINCIGAEYECVNDNCICAKGYIPNHYQTECVRCPMLGEGCSSGPCCDSFGNETLQCWQGTCQRCYDQQNIWICRDTIDQILLISITQVIMATALVLGIVATFVLLYRLCAATNLRPLGHGANCESRLSVGSLQIYVEERLRDAPPRYSRTAPAGSSIYPAAAYLNAGFAHDSSIPPPPYTPKNEDKIEESHNCNQNANQTIHI